MLRISTLRGFLAYVTDDDKTPNKMREARRRVYDPAAQQAAAADRAMCACRMLTILGRVSFVIASLSCIVLLLPRSQYVCFLKLFSTVVTSHIARHRCGSVIPSQQYEPLLGNPETSGVRSVALSSDLSIRNLQTV